jgi:hypothetical protein
MHILSAINACIELHELALPMLAAHMQYALFEES